MVLSSPSLWTSITVNTKASEDIENHLTSFRFLLQKALQNSKDAPLQIQIGNMSLCRPEVEVAFMELLWPHRAHWASFEIRRFSGDGISTWRKQRQLSKSQDKAMPALRSLGLSLSMMRGAEEFLALFDESPALDKLSLRGFPGEDVDAATIGSLNIRWYNIRTLALTPYQTPHVELADLLGKMENLTVLRLSMLRLYDDEALIPSQTSQNFPELEAFMLSDTKDLGEPSELLPQIYAPLLRVLSLDRTSPEILDSFITNTIECNIIKLDIHHLESDEPASFTEVLARLPKLSLQSKLEPEVFLQVIQRLGELICPELEDLAFLSEEDCEPGLHSSILDAIADFLEARWPVDVLQSSASVDHFPPSITLQPVPRRTTRAHLRLQCPGVLDRVDQSTGQSAEPALERLRAVASRRQDDIDVDVGWRSYSNIVSRSYHFTLPVARDSAEVVLDEVKCDELGNDWNDGEFYEIQMVYSSM